MAQTDSEIDWVKLREIFPELPKEMKELTIRIKPGSMVEIECKFYPVINER